MSARRKLIVFFSICISMICIAILASFIILDHQRKLYEEQQKQQQYVNAVLLQIDDIYDEFEAAGDDRDRKIYYYNTLIAYQLEVSAEGFLSAEISTRFSTALIAMRDDFAEIYGEMIDAVAAKASGTIDSKQKHIAEVLAGIDKNYKSFTDAPDDPAEKATLISELSYMRDAFAGRSFLIINNSELRKHIDELNAIRDLIDEEGVLSDSPQLVTLRSAINRHVKTYTAEVESETFEEVLWKYDSTLERQKTWFSAFYTSTIDEIASKQAEGRSNDDAIRRQISDLAALKTETLDDGILGPCRLCCGHNEPIENFETDSAYSDATKLKVLHDRINELVRECNIELDRATPGGGENDDYAGIGETPEYSNIDDLADEVLRLTNLEREKYGLSPLANDNKLLSTAALIRANEIVEFWSHDRPDGRQCFTAYTDAGGGYMILGENLAYGQRTPEEAVQAWMDSEGHRENILTADFKQLGIGVVQGANGVYYWTQMFCG